MFAKIRAALAALVAYVEAQPGAVTLIGSEAVLLLARLGIHVTVQQLSVIVAILLPLVIGIHVAARHAVVDELIEDFGDEDADPEK